MGTMWIAIQDGIVKDENGKPFKVKKGRTRLHRKDDFLLTAYPNLWQKRSGDRTDRSRLSEITMDSDRVASGPKAATDGERPWLSPNAPKPDFRRVPQRRTPTPRKPVGGYLNTPVSGHRPIAPQRCTNASPRLRGAVRAQVLRSFDRVDGVEELVALVGDTSLSVTGILEIPCLKRARSSVTFDAVALIERARLRRLTIVGFANSHSASSAPSRADINMMSPIRVAFGLDAALLVIGLRSHDSWQLEGFICRAGREPESCGSL